MSSSPFLEMFHDPERAQTYPEGPAKFTPGFADLHKIVGVLIEECAPPEACVLVHGAGGGLEIESLAAQHREWTFVGVDPAKPMLDVARTRLAGLMDRITLHHGFIASAPVGPFDAATSLLTLHFLEVDERVDTLRRILSRLKPGAPCVVVHSSFPQREPERAAWLARYRGFAVASGVPNEMASSAHDAVAAMTTLLDPDQDAELLRSVGLDDVSCFYRALTWCGWIGYAP